MSRTIKGMIASVLLYYVCWILYYQGVMGVAVILGLTIFPCITFFLFAIDRHNYVAVVPILLFTTCHLTYTFINFIA